MNVDRLFAGYTLNQVVCVAGFPASDGWILKYALTPKDPSGTPIFIDSSADTDGTSYDVQAGPSLTTAWVPGGYAWNSWVEKTGEAYPIDSGALTILPNPATAPAGADYRSVAQKAVDDLTAAYATYNATQGHVSEYAIGGRSMKFRAAQDIQQALSFWKGELAKENAALSIAKGQGNPRRLFAAFGGRACASPWIR